MLITRVEYNNTPTLLSYRLYCLVYMLLSRQAVYIFYFLIELIIFLYIYRKQIMQTLLCTYLRIFIFISINVIKFLRTKEFNCIEEVLCEIKVNLRFFYFCNNSILFSLFSLIYTSKKMVIKFSLFHPSINLIHSYATKFKLLSVNILAIIAISNNPL